MCGRLRGQNSWWGDEGCEKPEAIVSEWHKETKVRGDSVGHRKGNMSARDGRTDFYNDQTVGEIETRFLSKKTPSARG